METVEEMVITVSGEEVPRGNCRYIKGEYYKVGNPEIENSGDCYKVNGRFYRVNTGRIVYDHEVKSYVLNNDTIILGVIGFFGESLVTGHFTKNTLKNVTLVTKDSDTYTVISEDIVNKNRAYRYCISEDTYYHITELKAKLFYKLKQVDENYKRTLNYDCREIIDRYTNEYNKNNLEVSSGLESLAKALKGLTFGAEFETTLGNVPQKYTGPLGLIPLRDGSVAGLEYATIPLSGGKGLAALLKSSEVLNKFTTYDNNCSLHLHIGNVPRTKEFFLAMFKTLCLLQDSVFDLFPIYKKYNFGVKRKNYTKPFPATNLLAQMDSKITPNNIDTNFDVLYRFLSMGQSFEAVGNNLDNVKSHPSDPRGTSKWNIKSRYYWVNLIPLLFGNKQTIEFRIHTPTTDKNKVLAYLFTCSAIVNFVKTNSATIISGNTLDTTNLYDIVHSEYGNLPKRFSTVLVNYLDNRRRMTLTENSKGNIIGDEEAITAKGFTWNYDANEVDKEDPMHEYMRRYVSIARPLWHE